MVWDFPFSSVSEQPLSCPPSPGLLPPREHTSEYRLSRAPPNYCNMGQYAHTLVPIMYPYTGIYIFIGSIQTGVPLTHHAHASPVLSLPPVSLTSLLSTPLLSIIAPAPAASPALLDLVFPARDLLHTQGVQGRDTLRIRHAVPGGHRVFWVTGFRVYGLNIVTHSASGTLHAVPGGHRVLGFRV